MSDLFDKLMAEAKAAAADVVAWRRHIHAHPELSWAETETAAYITATLKGFACPQLTLSHPAPTAVIADLKGTGGEGPIVAIRADIDALALDEKNEMPYKSTKKDVMHACGHDAHTAMALGACKVLCQHVAELKGTVRFVFQHAEEKNPGGAQQLCTLGAMDGVKSIVGMHVFPMFPVGTVALKEGIMTSCSDNFTLTVKGRGGHASMPHLLVDPIPIAAQVVLAVQTIVSRKIDAKLAPVLSICTMTTGVNETSNVVPDTVKLMGTIRSQDFGVRDYVPASIEKLAKGICEANGATCELELNKGYDMVNNDPAVTREMHEVAKRVVKGDERRIIMVKEPVFGGEDFSAYQQLVPGCFIGLGVGNKAAGIGAPLHSCEFQLDEDALPFGVCMHLGFVHNNLMV